MQANSVDEYSQSASLCSSATARYPKKIEQLLFQKSFQGTIGSDALLDECLLQSHGNHTEANCIVEFIYLSYARAGLFGSC